MRIGGCDTSSRVLVVAEIGNNHEGSAALAEEMIGLAAQAGADAVKFQAIVPDRLVAPTPANAARIEQLRRFQLKRQDFERLAKAADSAGVLFLATAFDIESAGLVNELVPAHKVASGDNNFGALIEYVAGTGKPLIISTGMANLEQLRRVNTTVDQVRARKGLSAETAFLHCVVSYPTPRCFARLLQIRRLECLGAEVGYSDHTLGIEAAVLAVGVGARIIEKHFTIAKDYSSYRDHRLSADLREFGEMVRRIREAEELLGAACDGPNEAELAAPAAVRRSIVAVRDLEAGRCVELSDLDWVRPGTGLPPGQEQLIVGRRLKVPIERGHVIWAEHLEG